MALTSDLVQVGFTPDQARLLGDGFISADSLADRYGGKTEAAINAAITMGRNVYVGPGTWTISSEISVVNDNQQVYFDNSLLNAGANSINIIHWSASDGKLSGHFNINGNSKTGVTALRITPLSETQTTTVVNQNFNTFQDIYITGCAEGIVLRCGPDVATADSGCWYNRFYNIRIFGCTRCIYLKDGTNVGSAGCNRNNFMNIRCGQGAINSGVYIESGDTSTFIDVHFEGVNNGTSPLATPTAIYVAQAGTHSGDNNHNTFISCKMEGNTRDIDNRNSRTELYAVTYRTFSFTANPIVSIGGDDPSAPIYNIGGQIILQSNNQLASHINGINLTENVALLSSKEIYDYNLPWATYAITTGICTNVTSIAAYKSKYRQFNGLIEWHFRMKFRATVGATDVTVEFPVAPNNDLYRDDASVARFMFPVYCQDGTANFVALARFSISATSPSRINISASAGGWNTAGNNNDIDVMVRYHV